MSPWVVLPVKLGAMLPKRMRGCSFGSVEGVAKLRRERGARGRKRRGVWRTKMEAERRDTRRVLLEAIMEETDSTRTCDASITRIKWQCGTVELFLNFCLGFVIQIASSRKEIPTLYQLISLSGVRVLVSISAECIPFRLLIG